MIRDCDDHAGERRHYSEMVERAWDQAARLPGIEQGRGQGVAPSWSFSFGACFDGLPRNRIRRDR